MWLETFEPGTYEVDVDGRYWTGFDRMHPIDGQVREQAWSGTAHGLIGELGVGNVTHSALQMGLESQLSWRAWAPRSSSPVPAWCGRAAARRPSSLPPVATPQKELAGV